RAGDPEKKFITGRISTSTSLDVFVFEEQYDFNKIIILVKALVEKHKTTLGLRLNNLTSFIPRQYDTSDLSNNLIEEIKLANAASTSLDICENKISGSNL
ncbi:7480_t:CDS:1, partial [Dentiscutata heterogama]